MSKYQASYKRNINYEERRSIRALTKEKQRRESRIRNYASNRNIEEDILKPLTECLNDKRVDKRTMQFMLWKQEKEKKRMAEIERKSKEKPPFKCGVVHYKPSPVDFPVRIRRSKTVNISKLETTSFAPRKYEFKVPKTVVPVPIIPQKLNAKDKTPIEKFSQKSSKQNLSCNSCTLIKKDDVLTKGASISTLETKQPNKRVTRSFNRQSGVQPRRSTRLSNNQVQCSNSQNVENTNSALYPSISENLSLVEEEKSEGDDKAVTAPLSFIYPVNLSPWISVSRGSGSGKKTIIKTPDAVKASGGLRKQIGVRLIEKILSNPKEIENEEKKFLSTEDVARFPDVEDQDLKHFRDMYSQEMKRLESICLEWDALLISEDIPVDVQDCIRLTVGQTRLLMREKLAQFKGLVDECASCNAPSKEDGQQLVTPSDLQGFWDLVSIQVNDVDTKFSKLKTRQDNNWIEMPLNQDEPEKRKLRVRNVNKNPIKPVKQNTEKKSAFQLYLQEQKKKKQEKEERENLPFVLITTPSAVNTSVRSILRSGKGRKSSKMSLNRSVTVNQGGTNPENVTPRRVTFRDVRNDEEGSHGIRKPVTPHVNSLKGRVRPSDFLDSLLLTESPKSCTPMPKGDLISWESPCQDVFAVRRSPRIKRKLTT